MSDGGEARKVIVRAWKDEEYRKRLPDEVREKIPPAPESASSMSDEELQAAAGGGTATIVAGALGTAVGGPGGGAAAAIFADALDNPDTAK